MTFFARHRFFFYAQPIAGVTRDSALVINARDTRGVAFRASNNSSIAFAWTTTNVARITDSAFEVAEMTTGHSLTYD